jgi:PAS domain S-box-containing protein
MATRAQAETGSPVTPRGPLSPATKPADDPGDAPANAIGGATALGDVLERVSDAVVALDRNWRYTYVNRHAAALFGRRPEDLIGRHIWTEFPEGRGQPFHLAYEKAMAEQTFVELESYYAPWDRWFENRIFPSADGLSIFFHEITDRKRAEQTAGDSVRLLEGQNRVLERIVRGDPLEQTLDLLLRFIEAECPGMLASVLLLDADGVHVRHGAAPSLPAAYTAAIDGAAIGPRAGSCGTAAYRGEPVIVEDIDVDPLWDDYRSLAAAHGLRACWSTPIFDSRHRVLGTFALYFHMPARPEARHQALIAMATHTAAVAILKHRESEERARAELEIRARQSQLAEAQSVAHLGSYQWDVVTNVVSRSDELLRIFGETGESFEPTLEGYLRRVHADDRSRTRDTIERAFRDGAPFEFEERIIRSDGAVRILRSRGKWVSVDGVPVRLVGICQDITERRHAEQQLRQREDEIARRRRLAELLESRNEELKAFAYTVSHDLKAPLRGIAGYAQELNRRHRAGLDERALLCIDRILAATRNLDRLIEDLLRYSRLDAETPTPSEVDLAALIGAILDDCRLVIVERQADVALDLAATRVRAWERGLSQVMANLIDNALKYSDPARPPLIRIASRAEGSAIHIAVTDNGIGFDMRYHDRIFGLFNRLVRQEDFDGTGAGLAIVRKVLEKMGGRIRAESRPGTGSTFFVELPGANAEAGA